MNSFPQQVVNAPGLPLFLEPTLFKTTSELSAELDGALARSQQVCPCLGVAVLLAPDEGLLEAIAFAAMDKIFVLYPRFMTRRGSGRDVTISTDTFSALLLGQKVCLVGFGMARIAMHIRHALNTHVRGIELVEAVPQKDRNVSPGVFVRSYVDPNANTFAVDTLWDAFPADLKDSPSRLEYLCLRAWLTARIGAHPQLTQALKVCVPVDTMRLSSKYFKPIHQMLVEVEQMEAAKPRTLDNEFSSVERDPEGKFIIFNERFNNRVRPSDRTEIAMFDEAGIEYRGRATSANGKQTRVVPLENTDLRTFKGIRVLGKEELNQAERARDGFLLEVLQGKRALDDPAYELIRHLFFPGPNPAPTEKVTGAKRLGRLNQSQADVVEAMVGSEAPFVIVHGPPGTGKTSTISVAAQEWIDIGSSVWVVAQSNIGVKNIAEKLCKDNVKFRILVSKEFYFEWNEHIYEDQVKESLIRTDELPATSQEMSIAFHEVRVVLCTLSTISNPNLNRKGVFNFVPMENLVVDEASQIGIFNFMHVFAQSKRLHKVCFFGDPKQLPPYGQDVAPTLQCVFDVKHLKSQAYFLNTQYRMPIPLGAFISSEVYNSKLLSEHHITSPSCVAFIDVTLGEEEERGKSFINQREVQTVIHLARYYYNNKNYCVITPYDSQRNELQKTLKAEGLRWDNVYNVDSFQGNEADFIIVSVVRTTSPGFLISRNRVNVLLTRCRKGMVVVTSLFFVQQRNVRDTLLGQLHQHWEQEYDHDVTWNDWKAVAEEKADLPGAPGRRRKSAFPKEMPYSVSSTRSTDLSRSLFWPLSTAGSRNSTATSIASSASPSTTRVSPTMSDLPAETRYVSSQSANDLRLITSSLHRTHLGLGSSPSHSANPSSFGTASVDSRTTASNAFPGLLGSSRKYHQSSFPGLPSLSHQTPVSGGAWSKGPPLPLRPQGNSRSSNLKPSDKFSAVKGMRAPSTSSRQKKTRKWEPLTLI